MKKTKRALIIGVAVIGLFCYVCICPPELLRSFLHSLHPDITKWEAKRDVAYYHIAAKLGSVYAKRELGSHYFSGVGVPVDKVEAVKWLRAAAEEGDTSAQCFLASCYFNGKGVPEDKTEAVRWYRIAAEHGDSEGQMKLGSFYFIGIVVPKNEEEAVKWFHKAAEQEWYYAKYILGRCYFEGTGVPKDDTEATKWLRTIRWDERAAGILKEIESGNPRAPNPQWGEEAFPYAK
jgi:hypothetical protein